MEPDPSEVRSTDLLGVIPGGVQKPDWHECNHQWRTVADSMYSNERTEDVVCAVCDCPGERTITSGTVYWPAT